MGNHVHAVLKKSLALSPPTVLHWGAMGKLEPDTKFALLPSTMAGRATRHHYHDTVEIESLADGCRSFEFLFACEVTGALRRWGYVDVEVH